MTEVSCAPGRISRWLPWLPLAAGALAVAHSLAPVWTSDPNYRYGWAVPALSAWLLAERWRTRPAPAAAPLGAGAFAIGLVLLWVAWWPIRLVLEAFPDWRPVLWAAGLWLVALTLGLLHRQGGWPWQRHFAFPVGFFLTAIPWPSAIESRVLGGLLEWNVSFVAHALNALGQPVLQRGHLIETAGGLLGIDEACSGLRSLQAVLTSALFIGEWFRLRSRARLALLAGGLVLAFVTNAVRSLGLAWAAADRGLNSLARTHDPAGWITLAVCVTGLWWLAWRLRPSAPPAMASPALTPARALPGWTAAALVAGLLLAEAGTTAWYRWREASLPVGCTWAPAWPEVRPGFRRLPILPAARAVLQLDDGRAAAWNPPGGGRWLAHWLRWEPRPVARALLAQFHTPDVCLPATGCLLRAEWGPVTLPGPVGPLRFRGFTFEEAGRPVFVFYVLTEDRRAGGPSARGSLPLERLRLVWEGQRRTGQTALHLALRGLETEAEAEAALRREWPDLQVERRAPTP